MNYTDGKLIRDLAAVFGKYGLDKELCYKDFVLAGMVLQILKAINDADIDEAITENEYAY